MGLHSPGDCLNTNCNLRVPSQSFSLHSCKMEKRHRVLGTVMIPERLDPQPGRICKTLVNVRPRRTWNGGPFFTEIRVGLG